MEKPSKEAKKAPKNAVKVMHMAVGLDLLGSKTSMAADRNVYLEMTAIGIKMLSKASGRVVVVPYSNVKGFELYPDSETDEA